jgi:hypothetical protein
MIEDPKYYNAYSAALLLLDHLDKCLKIQVKVDIGSQEYGITEINRSEESDEFLMSPITSQLRPKMDIRPFNKVTTHTTTFDLNKTLSEINGVDSDGSTVMQSNKVLNFVLR